MVVGLVFVLFCISTTAAITINDVILPEKIHSPHSYKIVQSLATSTIFGKQNNNLQRNGVSASPPIVYPTDFGADPTGKTDSTAAFNKAVQSLLSKGSGHHLANGITDLGGATLDLGGGDYLISGPIVIPLNYGNFRIQTGTLRASSTFPSSRYLIEVGDSTCSNSQGSCNENIGFSDLMLDSQLYCSGGLLIFATMGANVGPQMFFLGFNKAGISIRGGHETMIHETWLGQYLYSDSRAGDPTATAIEIFGNDHYVTNTIVFSSRVGVEVTGAANLLTGVHTWNLASSQGGIGILINAPGYTQNRLVACYLDYNSIVAVSPEHLTIESGFFLCGGNIVLSTTAQHRTINGLNIVNNQWDLCTNDTIVLDESAGSFTSITDVVINNNMMNPNTLTIRSTQATAKLTQSGATQWTFDFTDRLLFPNIYSVQYSIEMASGSFARHASRPPVGRKVTIETDQPVTGTVTVFVDESVPSHVCAAKCK